MSESPRAFLYARVSTIDQADSGLGLNAQADACRQYYERELQPKGFAYGGLYQDAAVSGRKPFYDRKAGGEMCKRLHRGDAIVIAKTDRAFRNLRDTAIVMHGWESKGVAVHLLDLRVDTSSPVGRLLVAIMASFAEFESRRISERTKAAMEVYYRTHPKISGLGMAPLGYYWSLDRDTSEFSLRERFDEQSIMRECHRLHRIDGLLQLEVAEILNERGIVHPRTGRVFKRQHIHRYIQAEDRRLARGGDPPPVPSSVRKKCFNTEKFWKSNGYVLDGVTVPIPIYDDEPEPGFVIDS